MAGFLKEKMLAYKASETNELLSRHLKTIRGCKRLQTNEDAFALELPSVRIQWRSFPMSVRPTCFWWCGVLHRTIKRAAGQSVPLALAALAMFVPLTRQEGCHDLRSHHGRKEKRNQFITPTKCQDEVPLTPPVICQLHHSQHALIHA